MSYLSFICFFFFLMKILSNISKQKLIINAVNKNLKLFQPMKFIEAKSSNTFMQSFAILYLDNFFDLQKFHFFVFL